MAAEQNGKLLSKALWAGGAEGFAQQPPRSRRLVRISQLRIEIRAIVLGCAAAIQAVERGGPVIEQPNLC
jgi:hypothetical protein